MYICNRCGCTAMAQLGKKLVCLNCGNEQAKALSRQRSSCAPNPAQHNAATQKLIENTPTPVQVPRQQKSKTQVSFERPKKRKPLVTVILIIVSIIILVNVIRAILFAVIPNLVYTDSSSYTEEVGYGDTYEDYSYDDYQYVDGMPWYSITAKGKLSFDEYTYLAKGNSKLDIVLPDELNSYQVSAIGYDGFLFCEEITSVTVPDGVTTIETDAFWGCDNLKTIWLPDSITHIYYDAIYNRDSLEAVYYSGTQEEWDEIYVEAENDQLLDHLVILGS